MLKRILKVLGGIVALFALAVAALYLYIASTWKKNYADLARPNISAKSDAETIAKGDYLVHAVAHCPVCHQSGQDMEERKYDTQSFEGGHEWNIPVFGRFISANLTSDAETGIGKVSDGDIARAIRYGVGRDGALLAFMRFGLGPMADEDLIAIVSYLRTLPPVKHAVGRDEPAIVGKFVLKKLAPRADAPPAWVPPGGISVERGRYLANGPAACATCHSDADPMNGMAPKGAPFAGASEPEPDATDSHFEILAPNLTPDPETGHITSWTEDIFVQRFKAGLVYPGSKMPWENFAHLTEDDVRSLYRYLRTVPAAKHLVGPTRRAAGYKPG